MSEKMPPSPDAYTETQDPAPDDPAGYEKLFEEISYTTGNTDDPDSGPDQ